MGFNGVGQHYDSIEVEKGEEDLSIFNVIEAKFGLNSLTLVGA